MPAHRRYPNSPIAEAVIDIRVVLPPEFKHQTFDGLYDHIKTSYPVRENMELMHSQVSFAPEAPAATASRTRLGYLFRSANGRFVFQARTNGFTLARLQPYEHWDSFRDEAHRMWDIYREITKPTSVVRVAVRYINRIDIPLPSIELSDYLRTFPEISQDLPQVVQSYLMQLIIPLDQVTLSLIQTTAPASSPGITSINLDIDLFKENATDFDSDEKIWQFLEHLRAKKNDVFEGCITDKLRAIFGVRE